MSLLLLGLLVKGHPQHQVVVGAVELPVMPEAGHHIMWLGKRWKTLM